MGSFLILLPLFIFIYFFIKWLYPTTSALTTKNLPPSPSKLPIIGNLNQQGSLPHRSLRSLAQRYGGVMLLRFSRVPVVVIYVADAAREVMNANDIVFSNRPKSTISARLLYDYKDVGTTPYGEYSLQEK